MLELYPKDIEHLSDEQLPELLLQLLLLEAENLSIPTNQVHVPSNIKSPDGGEDGRIEVNNVSIASDYIYPGINVFQVKAGKMTTERCYQEVLTENKSAIKPNVKNVIDKDGTYILFYKYQLVEGSVEESTYGDKSKKAGQVKYKYSGIKGRIYKIKEALIGKDPTKYKSDSLKIEIYDANKICNWANKYISAIAFVLSSIGKPLPHGLKVWIEWSQQVDFTKFNFVKSDEISQNINRINKSLKDSKKVIRVIGSSGLGKTRLVFEAFRENSEKTCVYINANDAFNLTSTINSWQRQRLNGILIIDDCPKELHDRIRQEILIENSRLKLITIGHDCDEPLSYELIIKVEPASIIVIKNIIKQSQKPEYVQLSDQVMPPAAATR